MTLAEQSTPGSPAPGCVPAPTTYKFFYPLTAIMKSEPSRLSKYWGNGESCSVGAEVIRFKFRRRHKKSLL